MPSEYNCDVIIKCWHDNNTLNYENLKNNKLVLSNYDDYCLSCSLSKYEQMTKSQRCLGCKKVACFLENEILKKEDEIDILFGNRKGEKIYFFSYDFFNKPIEENKYVKNISNFLTKKYSYYYNKDYFYINNIKYFPIKDKYLNLIINYIILENIIKNKHYPNSTNFLNFFICQKKINFLRFKFEIEDFKNLCENPYCNNQSAIKKNNYLTTNIVCDILKQIVVFFIFFKKFYFCHNEASIKFLKFSLELNNFEYEDKKILSPIKVSILPSFFSSISIYDNNRDNWSRFCYYHKEFYILENIIEKIDVYLYDNSERNKLKIPYNNEYLSKSGLCYKIGNEGNKFLKSRRYYGSPCFYSSFDIICFFTSLMLENSFSKTLLKNKKLLEIWKGLWKREEYDTLMSELQKIKNNNFEEIFSIIRKYFIRFDALEYLEKTLF